VLRTPHCLDNRLIDGGKVVSLTHEWTGEFKDRPVHEFFTQIEPLASVSGWNNQDKAFIVKAKLQGLALQFFCRVARS
jgi:hypothetical protein